MDSGTLTREDVLALALKQHDGKQGALAESLGQAPSSVSRWLSGRSHPDVAAVLKLAKLTGAPRSKALRAFDYDPADLGLMDGETPPDPRDSMQDVALALARISRELLMVSRMVSQSTSPEAQNASGTPEDYVRQEPPFRLLRFPRLVDAPTPAFAG